MDIAGIDRDVLLNDKTTMSLDALRPVGGDHAIQTAAVALTWAAEISPSELQSLRSKAATAIEIKKAFPTIEDRHIIKFGINVNVPNTRTDAQSTSVQAGPFVLNSLPGVDGATPAQSILVDMRQVVISVTNYDRWDRLIKDLNIYLPALFSGFSARKSISTIGLQYVDTFEWEADRSELNLRTVFKETSPYLVSNVFRTVENWHSHHGLFTAVDKPLVYRRLDNINISREEQDARQILQVVTSHQAQLTTVPLWRWADTKFDVVLEILHQLHFQNKQMLRELLTPEVQSMINLNVKNPGG